MATKRQGTKQCPFCGEWHRLEPRPHLDGRSAYQAHLDRCLRTKVRPRRVRPGLPMPTAPIERWVEGKIRPDLTTTEEWLRACGLGY